MSSVLQQSLTHLKEVGIRVTPQRCAILSYLLESMSHPTVDDIYKALNCRFPTISIATIYNNLHIFKKLNLIRELTYGDHASRFDANMKEHYHAVCTECGELADFTYPSLKKVEQDAGISTGFAVKSHRMEVYGVCPACSIKK